MNARALPGARLAPAFAGLGLFLLYLSTAAFDVRQNVDALSTLVPAWELASHGDVYLGDQYAEFTRWFVEVDGHAVSNRLPGTVLWAAPFYALLGRGGTYAPFFPAAVASATAATLAVVFVYLTLRRLTARGPALCAAAVLALATPTWNISSDSLWTHGPAQLALAVSLWCFAGNRLAGAGLALAAAIVVRPHLAVVAAVTGIWEAVVQRRMRPLLVVGLTSAIGVVAFLAYNRAVFGEWSILGGYGAAGGYETESPTGLSLLTNAAGAFVSPGRGLFVYSPFLLLLLPGVPAAWRCAPTWVRSTAMGGLVYLAVQLWTHPFAGGEDFFAYRLLLEPLTLATPLLTLAYLRWTGLRSWRTVLFWGLVFFSAAWQLAASLAHPNEPPGVHLWPSTTYDDVARERPVLTLAALLLAAAATVVVARLTARRAPRAREPRQPDEHLPVR